VVVVRSRAAAGIPVEAAVDSVPVVEIRAVVSRSRAAAIPAVVAAVADSVPGAVAIPAAARSRVAAAAEIAESRQSNQIQEPGEPARLFF
jgi:hypothetical protein